MQMHFIDEDYKLKVVAKKDVCKPSLMRKIVSHSMGSLYRMNAKSADCYAFCIDGNGKDWSGGWDWSKSLVDGYTHFILMLESQKVFKVIQLKN